jgi:hypothetical protein
MSSICRAFVFLVFSGIAGEATACVVIGGPSFINYCGYTVMVHYDTQGGDCSFGTYGHGVAGPIRPGNTTVNPILGGCYVKYTYSEYRAWVARQSGVGTPRPSRRRLHVRDLQ